MLLLGAILRYATFAKRPIALAREVNFRKFPRRESIDRNIADGLGHRFNPYVTMGIRVGRGFTMMIGRKIDLVIVFPLLFRHIQ